MSFGSSSGTFARAAFTICTVRSSARISVSEPLKARPIGERAVETITASGISIPLLSYAAQVVTKRLLSIGRLRHAVNMKGRP